jgi:ferrochelatase
VKSKKTIFLVQLGSPKDPSVPSVRTYLKEFLGDPRLIDLPRIVWLPILYLFVLPFRPKKSAEGYQRLWQGDGFPLVKITKEFAEKLKNYLPKEWDVRAAFVLSEPRFSEELNHLKSAALNNSTQEVWVVPQYPQYSEATTASIVDLWAHQTKTWVNMPAFHFLPQYFNAKCFIDESIIQINQFLQTNTQIEELVFSFHGLPKKRITEKKDDYYWQCLATFDLISKSVKFPSSKMHIAFQSQFGRDQWLTPSTINRTEVLLESGAKHIAVYCPSFVVDCLETSIEIGEELQEEMHEHFPDAHIHLIPCLNTQETWVKSYANYLKTHLAGSDAEKNQLNYEVDREQYLVKSKKEIDFDLQPKSQPKRPMNSHTSSEPLSPQTKKSLFSIFLIAFVDLLGFSIIFPLIPAISNHYLSVDAANPYLQMLWQGVYSVGSLVGAPLSDTQGMVLFGCLLGAIYSFLQFFATVFWGNLSDKIGRKKILIISTVGMAFSYLLWIFSGSFTLLILSRLVGGLMSGNISVASAAVADVTNESQRSKGMASIGIAFALGFVFGPAIGGLSMLINLPQLFPSLVAYGLNPFSAPALIAFILAVINVVLLVRFFHETWTPSAPKDTTRTERTWNVLKIFSPLPIAKVNFVNFAYFLFIAIFSGMEFTLTFLTVERLNYAPMHNGFMFVFIGLMIALVQGGFVRRRAHVLGEDRVAVMGLVTIIPGLILIAYAQSTFLLLIGLFFLAAGSAMAIPCLTSLVSLFSPRELQGKSLGIFRSLGAIGRIVGPLAGSIIFWRFGSQSAYLVGAVALILPMLLMKKIKTL